MIDQDLGPLEGILGLSLRLAHGAVQRHFTENFGSLGLTQKQVSVLWLAESEPGIAQTDIARRLDMDRATTMAIVHALEQRGFLRRTRSERDARRIAFHLTDEGEARLGQAKSAIREHETWLKARFDADELQMLTELLVRIRR